jgi:5-methylcytosine-specific restriction endonuclease McrA
VAWTRKRRKLWRLQYGLCWLCDMKMEFALATFDHIVPQSLGGGHAIDNLKLAHKACNRARKAVPACEAREYVQRLLAQESGQVVGLG